MTNRKYLEAAEQEIRNEWKSAEGEKKNNYSNKIIYMNNFNENYRSANGAGDVAMKKDIIFSALATLINNQPEKVRIVYLESFPGEGRFLGRSQRQLIKAVSSGLHRSRRFAVAIASLIISGNAASESLHSAAGNGDEGGGGGTPKTTETPTPKIDYGQIVGRASDLVKGLGSLFGGTKKVKAETEKEKAAADKARAEAERILAEKAKGIKGEKPNIGKYILGALLLAAATIGIISFARSRAGK